ncbi:MAG: hypothetical protein C4293_02170 [Nitrospiraceae bacterium]
MKIFTTLVFSSDVPDGKIYKVDTIGDQGKMWLVPEWCDNPREGWRMPGRIICLDSLPHQKIPGGPADFVLNAGIPKSVFDGQDQPQSRDGFLVIERQDIRFSSDWGLVLFIKKRGTHAQSQTDLAPSAEFRGGA